MVETIDEAERRRISDEALRRFFPAGMPEPGAITGKIAMEIVEQCKRELYKEEIDSYYNPKPVSFRKPPRRF